MNNKKEKSLHDEIDISIYIYIYTCREKQHRQENNKLITVNNHCSFYLFVV
jgi:hypothetical protein